MIFKHNNCDKSLTRSTFALGTCPTKETLLEMLKISATAIQLDFGITFVHKSDRYNKATGRLNAVENLKPTVFYLTKAFTRPAHENAFRTVFEFKTVVKCPKTPYDPEKRYESKVLNIGFSFLPESLARFEYAFFEEL